MSLTDRPVKFARELRSERLNFPVGEAGAMAVTTWKQWIRYSDVLQKLLFESLSPHGGGKPGGTAEDQSLRPREG